MFLLRLFYYGEGYLETFGTCMSHHVCWQPPHVHCLLDTRFFCSRALGREADARGWRRTHHRRFSNYLVSLWICRCRAGGSVTQGRSGRDLRVLLAAESRGVSEPPGVGAWTGPFGIT